MNNFHHLRFYELTVVRLTVHSKPTRIRRIKRNALWCTPAASGT